jgi:hypothetical protein
MTIWERHAERERRRAEFEKISQWLDAHPVQAMFWALGIGVFLFEVSALVMLGLDAIARMLGP